MSESTRGSIAARIDLFTAKIMKSYQKDIFFRLMGMVGIVGFLVLIPLILFSLLGRAVDKTFDSSPLFFLIGVVVAIIFSTILIYRKTCELMHEAEKKGTEKSHEK